MSEKPDYLCRVFKSEDEKEVTELVRKIFGDTMDSELWNWKYKQNPNFNPSLIMVAEKKGVIIGCNHWLLNKFKLSPRLETKAVLGAELAVHPDYRGKGVGKSLLHSLRSSEVMKSEKPLITHVFVRNPSMAKGFHAPLGGYIPAPVKTVYYIKTLNWKEVEENAGHFNEQVAAGKFVGRLANLNLKVLFKFSNAPPLYFHMTDKGVTVGESGQNYEKDADVIVASDVSTIQKIKAKKKRVWNISKAMLTGRLKIKGKFGKLRVLYKNLWILLEIMRTKTT